MRRWIGVAVIALVLAGAVVGLSTGGHDDSGVGAKSSTAASTGRFEGAGSAGGGSSAPAAEKSVAADAASGSTVNPAPVPTPGGTPVPGVQPRIARTAELHLGVRRSVIADRLRDAETFVAANGGYVVRSESGRDFGSIVVRVPADRYDEAVRRFGSLGTVTASSQSGTDRTAEYVDREARLRNLRAQEATLQDIMRQARTVPDTIAVQTQLAAVQEQIEQLVSQQQLLEGETTFATITASFTPTGAPPAKAAPAERSTLGQAWADAVDALVAVLGGMIVVAGALLPFVLLAALGYGGWRAVRRRPRLDGANV